MSFLEKIIVKIQIIDGSLAFEYLKSELPIDSLQVEDNCVNS